MALSNQKLETCLLILALCAEMEAKYKAKISFRILDQFLRMPDKLFKQALKEDDNPFGIALHFIDYEWGLYAGDLSLVPKVHRIDEILSSWLIEYIKWKPEKTPQDEEELKKVEEWEAIKNFGKTKQKR